MRRAALVALILGLLGFVLAGMWLEHWAANRIPDSAHLIGVRGTLEVWRVCGERYADRGWCVEVYRPAGSDWGRP
ncbi:MAG: hypothetical protein SFU83_23520 [Meiothermus sp.]|nr:hypothetical protein [Meiothermus sp.]